MVQTSDSIKIKDRHRLSIIRELFVNKLHTNQLLTNGSCVDKTYIMKESL